MSGSSLPPYFRDPDLAVVDAVRAMKDQANAVSAALLNARLTLLRVGLADCHPMCKVLDSMVSAMTEIVTNDRIVDPLPTIRSVSP